VLCPATERQHLPSPKKINSSYSLEEEEEEDDDDDDDDEMMMRRS